MKIIVIERPRLKREMIGRRVRLKRGYGSGYDAVAAGSLATVKDFWKGLSIIADECECCGARISVDRVPYSSVEFIEEID